MKTLVVPITIFGILMAVSSTSADWPQFRGLNSAGVASDSSPPTEFQPGVNELWRLPIAPGHSSPCIHGDNLFITTYEEEEQRLNLVCIDRKTGQSSWTKSIQVEEVESGHPSFNPASSTPASDGDCVVAYFGSFGLVCYGVDGEKRWDLSLPVAQSYGGNAISPVIIDDMVILYRGNYVDHYLLALDKHDGSEVWRTELHERFTTDMSCTATPIVANDRLILHAVRSIQAFRIDDGARIWRLACKTTATSTPVIANDEVIVATWNQTGEHALTPELPDFDSLVADNDRNSDRSISRDEYPRLMLFHRSEGTDAPHNGAPIRFDYVDKDKDGQLTETEWDQWLSYREASRADYVQHGILAIKLDSEGEIDPDDIRRLASDSIPEVPSPLCDDEFVYFVKNGGILTCLDRSSGDLVYRIRTGGRGTHYASPIIAGSFIYTTSGQGQISVVRRGADPEVIATNDLGSNIYASPAVVDDTLYVRTHETLYAFSSSESADE